MSKVIVITGASAGIGKTVAKKLAARGDYLMLAARRYQELRQVTRECGRDSFSLTTDMTRKQDVERLREEAIRTFDHVDVWINNAGRGITKSVMELTEKDVDEMMTANLKSVLYGMQAIVPHFVERKQGHIINVSSGLARLPMATSRSAYSAAKSAMNTLTANLRMDLHRDFPDIHVSLVIPGPVDTEFAENALYSTGPLGIAQNVQTAEEVADTIIEMIDHPCAEMYTNPTIQKPALMDYLNDIDGFETKLLKN
jgi:short-subunit dehydrogenase